MQVVGEILLEFGVTSARESLQQRTKAHPVLAGLGVFLLGGIAGLMTRFICLRGSFNQVPSVV